MVILKKKYILISSIIIFGLGFLYHSIYDMAPSILTSIFFPVNESVFEHNKMILTSYITLYILSKFYFKDDKRNILFSTFSSMILCMILETSIFGFIYIYILKMKESMIIALITYGVSILISQILWSILIEKEKNKDLESIGLVGILIVILMLTVASYNPPKGKIFYDYKHNLYGIKKDN